MKQRGMKILSLLLSFVLVLVLSLVPAAAAVSITESDIDDLKDKMYDLADEKFFAGDSAAEYALMNAVYALDNAYYDARYTVTDAVEAAYNAALAVYLQYKATVPVNDVILYPTSATLTAGGDPVALTAAVSPAGATDRTVKWSTTGGVTLYSDETCNTPVTLNTATDTLTVYAKGTAAGIAAVTVTSNADSDKLANCVVTVNAVGYTVTLSGGANATIDGATSQTGLTGAMTTVTYTANSGYTFPAFSNSTTNGVTLTRVSDTVVTVSGMPTDNVNITVPDAAAIPTYTVTYKVVNGTWSDGSTADKTETVASGAKPANVPTGMIPSAGYMGGAWDKNPADATITEATTFTYTFGAIPTFNVTVSETPNGTVTASKTTATAGENITLTITPASGYQIQATTVTDVNNNNIPVSNNSFTMPAANVVVTVTFIEKPVQPTSYIVSFAPNGGGGVMNPVEVPANTSYTLPACGFTPPAGMQFKAWMLGSTEIAPGDSIIVDCNAEFVALWKNDEGGDITFIGGFGGGDDGGYDGGYIAPQRAWRVSFAPMQGGSAALVLNTGESGETMNVYPQTTVRVVPSPAPGYKLASIVWSLIDGSASYDITQAQTFVMPAMDAVVHVTFVPVG